MYLFQAIGHDGAVHGHGHGHGGGSSGLTGAGYREPVSSGYGPPSSGGGSGYAAPQAPSTGYGAVPSGPSYGGTAPANNGGSSYTAPSGPSYTAPAVYDPYEQSAPSITAYGAAPGPTISGYGGPVTGPSSSGYQQQQQQPSVTYGPSLPEPHSVAAPVSNYGTGEKTAAQLFEKKCINVFIS